MSKAGGGCCVPVVRSMVHPDVPALRPDPETSKGRQRAPWVEQFGPGRLIARCFSLKRPAGEDDTYMGGHQG